MNHILFALYIQYTNAVLSFNFCWFPYLWFNAI